MKIKIHNNSKTSREFYFIAENEKEKMFLDKIPLDGSIGYFNGGLAIHQTRLTRLNKWDNLR